MDQIIYQQTLNTFDLQFVRSDQPKQCSWKTVLINTVNKKELVLHTDSIVKNEGWKHYESTGEAPGQLYNIGGAMLDNKDLYIIYSRLGVITLYKYHFVDSYKFEVTRKTLQSYFSLPSYGEMTCNAHFIKIGSDLYISLCTGQAFFGKIKTTLYRINPNIFDIKEVEFDSNPTIACAIYITEESKRWMNAEKTTKEEELSKYSIESLKILNQHLEQPYYFKKLDADRSKRDKQISQIKTWGFDFLSFWDNSTHTQIISTQGKHIKQVLEFSGQKLSSDFKLLEYINNTHKDPLNNVIYYFYQEKNSRKIIRYDKYFSIWLISDFMEIEINFDTK